MADHSAMPDWKMRLLNRMDETGHNMKSLSLEAGLGETAVRDILKRTNSPSLEAITKIARVLEIPVADLIQGPPNSIKLIDVVGEVGNSGASWFPLSVPHQIAVDEHRRVYAITTCSNEFAVISGDAIWIFEKTTEFVMSATAGEKMLLTKDGRRFFGVISQDRRTKEYFLTNQGGEIRIPQEEVEWFAAWKSTHRKDM